MIAACKVESKNEEAQDKVMARSAVTTKPVKGTTELGNQIAKLMAALTRAGQGNSPSSAPNSPRQRGCRREQTDRKTPGHANSIMAELVWDRLLLPAAPLLAMAQGPPLLEARDRMPKDPKIAREALQIGRTPAPSSVSGAKVGATWLKNVPPQPRL